MGDTELCEMFEFINEVFVDDGITSDSTQKNDEGRPNNVGNGMGAAASNDFLKTFEPVCR